MRSIKVHHDIHDSKINWKLQGHRYHIYVLPVPRSPRFRSTIMVFQINGIWVSHVEFDIFEKKKRKSPQPSFVRTIERVLQKFEVFWKSYFPTVNATR